MLHTRGGNPCDFFPHHFQVGKPLHHNYKAWSAPPEKLIASPEARGDILPEKMQDLIARGVSETGVDQIEPLHAERQHINGSNAIHQFADMSFRHSRAR